MFPIDYFYRGVRRKPDAVAVEYPGGTLTYTALLKAVQALAAAMQNADPVPQTRVGICCHNNVEHLVAWLATLAAGKIWIPLYPRNGRPEINRIIAATAPSILIVDEDCLDLIDETAATIWVGRRDTGGSISTRSLWQVVDDFAGRRPATIDLPRDALQAIKFTGGSTGLPKGVMQPYRCWNSYIASQIHHLGLDAQDRYLVAAPITHGCSTFLLPTLAQGGCLVFIERNRPPDILHAFRTRGITTMFAPPTLIYMLLEEPEAEAHRYPALKHLVYAGAPMRVDSIRQAQEVFGPALETSYGQAEAPEIMTFMTASEFLADANVESVGRAALLTEVGIMGPDGALLEPGETGEVVGRGDLLMAGYWKQPDKTAEAIVDGWLHTGDVGYLDERGYLFLKDRKKDMVITGGFNVYPTDVENALGKHPDVADCAVFGVADRKWGEAVHAAVQLKPGADPDAAALIAFVKSALGSVQAPKAIHFYDELPKSYVGKTLKRILKENAEKDRQA